MTIHRLGPLLLLTACNGGPSAADAGGCKVATDCPEINCQCPGGGSVASYCLCEGGKTTSGQCGPGAACAQTGDCGTVCSQVSGPGGNPGGGTGGGGGGGGQPCASQAECGVLPCTCDGGTQSVQTYCLQGQCSCPAC